MLETLNAKHVSSMSLLEIHVAVTLWVGVCVCSWPDGATPQRSACGIFLLFFSICMRSKARSWYSALLMEHFVLLHSLHLVELHGPLEVRKAGLVAVGLFENPSPILLGSHLSLHSSNGPLHVFQA